MDKICIHNLQVPTHIGVPEEERSTMQTLLITSTLSTDTRRAGASDDIDDTIDYADVAESILELGKTERKTIECFAEDIAQMILERYQPSSVQITIRKHILPNTDAVSVDITRP